MRDYARSTTVSPVVAEDSWGGEIATATLAHFAASTPADFLINATDLHNYNTRSTGRPGPETRDGKLYAPDTPGLGVVPDFDSLGPPVAVYGDRNQDGRFGESRVHDGQAVERRIEESERV